MFTNDQMKIMLKLQDSINTKVNPDWVNADNDWMLATMMESTEAIDHHGWKWWKHQESDLAQLQMELVDIWHFVLSHMITKNRLKLNTNNSFIFDNSVYEPHKYGIVKNLKLMAGLASVNRFEFSLFFKIVEQANLPFEDLFKQYVGKNVLNMFRQDNGYKEGTYIKIWYDGREDNEHLIDILENVYVKSKTADVLIYRALHDRYLKNTD